MRFLINFDQSISKLTLQMENANLPKDICEVEKLKMTQIGTQNQIIGHDFLQNTNFMQVSIRPWESNDWSRVHMECSIRPQRYTFNGNTFNT